MAFEEDPILPRGGWDGEVYQKLLGIIKSGSYQADQVAAFDFDGTFIERDIGEAVQAALALSGTYRTDLPEFKALFRRPEELPRRKFIHPPVSVSEFVARNGNGGELHHPLLGLVWDEYRWIMEEKGSEAAYKWAVQLLVGLSPRTVRKVTRCVWERELSAPLREYRFSSPEGGFSLKGGIGLYSDMLNLIRAFKVMRWQVWIVSASNAHSIQALAKRFGIPREQVIGVEPGFKSWHVFSSEIITPCSIGPSKVHVLKERGIIPKFASGNSEEDFHMLQYTTCNQGNSLVIGDKIPQKRLHPNWLKQPKFSIVQ